jgi:hypothetical protein
MKAFAKNVYKHEDTQALQDSVSQTLDPILRIPVIDGVQVSYSLVSGSNRISHPLQRIPQGWIIVDRNSAATVYRTAWDSRTISLTASGAINISVWVY